jgi:hypothetical protein
VVDQQAVGLLGADGGSVVAQEPIGSPQRSLQGQPPARQEPHIIGKGHIYE